MRENFKTLGLGLLMACVVGAFAPASVFASSLYVASTGDDGSGCESAGAPCRTIAHALQQASGASTTINVAAGRYEEDLNIFHPNEAGVQIVGEGSESSGTVIAGTGILVYDQKPGLVLSDLRIEPTGYEASAIQAGGEALTTEGVVIQMANASSGAEAVIVGSGSRLLDTTIEGSWTGRALQSIGSVTLEGDHFTSSPASTQGLVILERGESPATYHIVDSVIHQTNGVLPPDYNIQAQNGELVIDSSILIGGQHDLLVSDFEPEQTTILNSTIDAGEPGVLNGTDWALALVSTGTSPIEASLVGSATVEGQVAEIVEPGGESTINCSYSNVPDEVETPSGNFGAVNCGMGVEGNTANLPEDTFAGGAGPYLSIPDDYTPKVGSQGVDSVLANLAVLPGGFTPSNTDVLGNPRVANGLASCVAGVRDRGAIELQNAGAAPAPEISGPTPTRPVVGEEVTFQASAPTPPGNPAPTVTYQWEASDSATGSGATFRHTFARSGEFAVGLEATGAAECVGTTSATVTIDEAPQISSANRATFVTGTSGSFEVTTTGVPVPSIAETGALPEGMRFADNHDGTALLSGAPRLGTQGRYTIEITADNGVGTPATQAFTLVVNAPPAITSVGEATFVTGRSGSFEVTTTGLPLASLSETGALPSGVSFTDNHNGTATLSGVPAGGTQGRYAFEVTADNGVGSADTQTFTLTVHSAPAITSVGEATFVTGRSGSFEVTTSGLPLASLSETGALPSGVSFTDNHDGTATISGVPAGGTQGRYEIEISAENGINPAATQSFALTVHSAPAITSADEVTFIAGQSAGLQIRTTGLPTASLTETGALPSGVSFTDNHDGTATLAGVPAPGTQGEYPLEIKAENGVGSAATQTFTLIVHEAPQITSANETAFVTGSNGYFQVTTSGLPAAAIAESGALPTGVAFTDNHDGTATISGAPAATTQGTYQITVEASNGIGAPATQRFTLVVNAAPQITSVTGTTFTTGQDGRFQVTTTALPTASLSESGALPSGVSFTDNQDGTATISGTPIAGTEGTYQIALQATNGIGTPARQTFTLTVDTPASVTSANSATFTVAVPGRFQITTSGLPVALLTESGALPTGVSFTDNDNGTASLSGLPVQGTQGSYQITITAANGIGAPASQQFTLNVQLPPKPVAPTITRLTLSPSAFYAAPSRRGPFGTTITYLDTESATAKFVVVRIQNGHRHGHKCFASGARHRRGAPCILHTVVASFNHTDRPGVNSFHFHGCFSGCATGHRLAPGLYRLRVTPRNSAGKGKTVLSTFFRSLQ